jgi:CO/xanthine dehydrogenase Mo-binding subunit
MNADRRDFLKVSAALGGAFALEFSFPWAAKAAVEAAATEVNAWVVIYPDDRVVVRIARSEMGQGTYTALAQLVAEELDCDWAKVSSEFASPNEHVRRQAHLGFDVHRRQPGRAQFAGLRAQGRRQRRASCSPAPPRRAGTCRQPNARRRKA